MKNRQNWARILLATSMGILLSFLLGFGAFTQQLFVNGILGESDSLYETLTPSGFMTPLSFFDWIPSFYTLWHLPLSIAACYIAFRQESVRKIFLWLSVNIFVVLAIVDTGFFVVTSENSPPLTESLLSNALGSPLLAIALCLVLMAVRTAPTTLHISARLSMGLVPIVLGSLCFMVLFVLVKNLFWVTTSQISALVHPPLVGNYSSALEKGGSQKSFGLFLDTQISPEKLTWTGDAKHFGVGAVDLGKKARIRAYLMDGCPMTKTKDALKLLGKPVLEADDISMLGVGADDGLLDFSIHSVDGSAGYWEASDEDASVFSIEAGEKEKTLNLTKVISENVSVNHKSWQGEVIYRMDAFTVAPGKLVPRTFAVRGDSVTRSFTVTPDREMNIQAKLVCRPIDMSVDKLQSRSPLVSLFFRVSYPEGRSVSEMKVVNTTAISGLNGWLYIENITASEIGSYFSSGALTLMSIQGKFEELYVDGVKQDVRNRSWLYLQDGEISGKVEGSLLRIEGQTNSALLDGTRLTKTRWERIELAVKSLIVSVPTAVFFLLGIFWRAWKRDEELVAQAVPTVQR